MKICLSECVIPGPASAQGKGMGKIIPRVICVGLKALFVAYKKSLVYSLFGACAGMTKEYSVFPIPAFAGMTKKE